MTYILGLCSRFDGHPFPHFYSICIGSEYKGHRATAGEVGLLSTSRTFQRSPREPSQRAQYSLIKEYTLNYKGVQIMI